MSDIPRYKPVSNDRLGIADDADGKLCEYRHYEQLRSTVQSFAANVLRLGNEVRDLADENKELHKDYESLADEHTKLIERNKTLKAEVDALKLGSLLTAVDVLQFINLKAEVERLRASSFVTAVPIEQYERLRKAGDAIAICLCGGTTEDYNKRCALNWLAAKEGKQS